MSNHSQEDPIAIGYCQYCDNFSDECVCDSHAPEDELDIQVPIETFADKVHALIPAVDQEVIDAIDRIHRSDLDKKVLEARIESLQWALNDYNMPNTDTSENLADFIDELKAKQTKEEK